MSDDICYILDNIRDLHLTDEENIRDLHLNNNDLIEITQYFIITNNTYVYIYLEDYNKGTLMKKISPNHIIRSNIYYDVMVNDISWDYLIEISSNSTYICSAYHSKKIHFMPKFIYEMFEQVFTKYYTDNLSDHTICYSIRNQNIYIHVK